MEESKPLLLLQSSIDGDVDGSRNSSSSGSIGSSNKSDNSNVRGSSSSSSSGSISNLVKLGYSFGHAQNDLCGAMYFSYLLVFLEVRNLLYFRVVYKIKAFVLRLAIRTEIEL